ncbi:cation-transporting P-type ATPase [Actinomadura miaoliensis]|uniref:HAD-IC family P-type ATPase n=1 Tax=Actinomadura miaoliensis TaxID=430685 RepID=A0ABP7VXT8_9ACTN
MTQREDTSTPLAEGLSSADAALRLRRDGPNVLPSRPPVPAWRRVLSQLRDPLILVLLAAAALTLATGDWTDMAVILLVIVVNTAVGVSQEIRADRAISALSDLTAPAARVVRDGTQLQIPAADVVVGDLLVLAEGDIVPADAAVVEAAALLVDESALTGESVPVHKTATAARDGAAVPEDASVSAGTVVVKGRGRAVVTATGAASTTGRIAEMLGGGAGLTPLQRRLAGVGRMLAGVAVFLCAVVLALGLVRGQPVELMVITAISLVVAAVPESLPAVVTLGLALGARRMAARHALIRGLSAVETLGSVTVLATDKTGTLTEGRMVARRLWTPVAEATVTGSGYAPDGRIDVGGRALDGPDPYGMTELLTAAVLCNDARLSPPGDADGEWTALGDPTEAALLAAAAKLGIDRRDLHERFPRHDERPFDSDRKRMTTVHRLPDGRFRVVCKGAPETMLGAAVLTDDPELVAGAAARADELARDGFRVLAVAAATRPSAPGPGEPLERGLRLLGLVAIVDPPRTAAAATIAACRRAGIRPVLITGDHPGTARAVAAELGVIGPDDPVADCRVPHAADDPGTAVFARATPAQKLDIIQAMRERGEVVAMTGDGVNDGPALRRSDIGVAMGRRGTEVARQAADLVLADDDLGTVVAATEEGRRVYGNIRRFLVYALSGGAAEIAVMLLGPAFGLTLPLLPAQILWINLLTHGLPGVALGGEPVERGAMDRPPRPPSESIVGAGLWQRVLRIAIVLTAVTLGVAVWAHHTGHPWQSMAFLALGATQLAVAIGSRSRPGSRGNPMLLVAVASALVLQLAGLYLPPLRDLLGTQPLTAGELGAVLGLSVLGYAAVRLDRVLHPAQKRRKQRR